MADDSDDLIDGIDGVFHAVDVAWSEGNDEVIDPDTVIFSEGQTVWVMWSAAVEFKS